MGKSKRITAELSDSDVSSIRYTKICNDDKTSIRYVYHISDIHIRTTKRHTEYLEVFEKLYAQLRETVNTESVIVLTGDIMHAKTELSPEAIHVARQLFISLGQIAPVFIIMGNHDCNLANRKRMDALSPILDPVDSKSESVYAVDNVYYLRDSGFYQYHNIVFGVTSVTGTKLIQAKHLNEKIWNRIKQKHKYRIALYHGPVHGSKTDVGYRMNRKELLAEHFNGYDFTMLGDIHRFQFLNEEKTVAYAGSLIQQTHGETIKHHGYVLWDLQRATGKHVEVPNSYGYCTIKLVDGKCVDDADKLSIIPKKPRLRFILENTNQVQYKDVLADFESKYQIQEIIVDVQTALLRPKNLLDKKVSKKSTLDPNAIVQVYLDKKNLDVDVKNSILKLHQEIYQTVCQNDVKKIKVRTTKNLEWELVELRFSNTLSYGSDNVVDFRRYRHNTIIGLFAPNFYGKSALIDILLFCLFEKLSRGDRRDILNTNKTKFSCSLIFAVGSKTYRIERVGKKNPNSPIVKVEVEFSLVDPKTEKILTNLNGVDKNDTNKKIVDIVGDYHDYLTTCFFLQNSSHDFMDMTQLQKKEYLHSILKLNVFESCHTHAKNHHKEITGQLKLLESHIGRITFDELKQKIRALQEKIDACIKQRENTTKSASVIVQYIIDTYRKSNLPIYSELVEYELKTESDIETAINKVKQKIEKISRQNLDELVLEHKKASDELEAHCLHHDGLKIRSQINSLLDHKRKLMEKIKTVFQINDSPQKLNSRIAEKKEMLATIRTTIGELEKSSSGVKLNSEDIGDQIRQINHDIRTIRRSIENIDTKQNDIGAVSDSLHSAEAELNSRLCEVVDHAGVVLDETSRIRLETKVRVYEKFQHRVDALVNLVESVVSDAQKSEQIRDSLLWMKSCDQFVKRGKNILNTDNVSITQSMKQCRDIRRELYTALHREQIVERNRRLEKQLDRKLSELDVLSEYDTNQKKMENLLREEDILTKQIQLDEEALERHDQNLELLKSNREIEQQIDTVEKEIAEHGRTDIGMKKITEELENSLDKCQKKLDSHKEQLQECSKLRKHLALLKQHHLEYVMWMRQNDIVKKWEEEKKMLDTEIQKLNRGIETKKLELHDLKSELKKYIELRREYDSKCSEVQLYQSYIQIMHHNGLPYEMLKVYLPIIESDVNQILHSIVTFSVSLVFASEDSERTDVRSRNSVNRLDIFICHANETDEPNKAYNAMLGSGFEKFIIGIAVRVALGKLSLTPKPNFMVIDEGWTCLDPDNMSNVEPIINYLKSQYDHILLISHADDLKSQADYILNISKERGFSYLNNSYSLKTLSITDESTVDSMFETPREVRRTNSDKAIKKRTKTVNRSKSKS